jgi:hypothetical protein
MTRKTLIVALVCSVAVVLWGAGTSQAFWIRVVDPWTGQVTWINSSRLSPGANFEIPGTGYFYTDPWTGAQVYRYLGIDGRWHSNTTYIDPFTGESTHVLRYAKHKTGGVKTPPTHPRVHTPVPGVRRLPAGR